MAWESKVIARVIAVLNILLVGCSCEIVKGDYELMPPLYSYENLTKCFEQYPTSAYCVVKTVIQPTPSSEVWQAIEKYSKIPSYHEHSLLDRGLCVEECIGILEGLSSSVKVSLDTGPVTVEPYVGVCPKRWKEQQSAEQRSRYSRILNMCVNYQLRQRYNLSGYSEMERCITPETHLPTIDAYHVIFVSIVVALLGFVSFASYKEWRLTQAPLENNTETNFPEPSKERNNALWMEFALQRSWSRLVASPKSQLQRDFTFVEIFRMLMVFLNLGVHVFMCYIAAPTANMRLLEEFYSSWFSMIAVSVFPFGIYIFFTISGVMLAVNFLEHAASRAHRVGWSLLWKGIVMRYVRIMPVLFLVWWYQVSWLDWFARGPGDYRLFTVEKENCRENGWLNFLFLNNYIKNNTICMLQTWYLAADFQFFLVGLPLLILINRRPRLLWPMITTVTICSIVSPILNLYYYRIPGVVLVDFKQLRFFFASHRVVLNDYILSHPHTWSYIGGLFAGIAYHRYRTSNNVPLLAGRTITARLLKWAPPTMVLLQVTFAPLFYDLDYSEPMLWNAVYGAIHRCCWGATCAVGILYGATLWQGRHSWVHFHPLVRLLSKLSFGVYMIQFNVIKSLMKNASDNGTEFNWKILLNAFLFSWIASYALAFVLAVMVEQPAATIFKRLLAPGTSQQACYEKKQRLNKQN